MIKGVGLLHRVSEWYLISKFSCCRRTVRNKKKAKLNVPKPDDQ
jgi:hypothetical protein